MKARNLHKSAILDKDEQGVKSDTLELLDSILKDEIDSIGDLEDFLHKVVKAAARIVSARSSRLVLYNQEEGEDLMPPDETDKTALTKRSIDIPLILRGLEHPIGHIKVEGRNDGKAFDTRDFVSLLMMGRQATLKIENDLFYRRIHEGMIEVLRSMVNILESRDPYIRCHSSRVTRYALIIAKDLDLPVEERDVMRIASLLHDIGKVGIPDSILSKRGSLTTEEMTIIQTHPLIGENIVEPMAFLSSEKSIIRYHHECYDGSGYPDGLKGEEIPLCARIISVADSFDAMTSHRPYRAAKSTEETLEEIRALRYIKYDPVVVQSFQRCMEKERMSLINSL